MKDAEFNEYVLLYQQGIYRFVYKMVNDPDDTKDIIQETFLRLWDQGRSLESKSVKSWLFTTSYRLSISCLKNKSRKAEQDVADIPQVFEDHPDRFNVEAIINKCLQLLSDLQKSVLMLKDYEGYSYSEIATILEISEDSVKVHLFRARKKIQEQIKDLKFVL